MATVCPAANVTRIDTPLFSSVANATPAAGGYYAEAQVGAVAAMMWAWENSITWSLRVDDSDMYKKVNRNEGEQHGR